jgi:hypothetical protein
MSADIVWTLEPLASALPARSAEWDALNTRAGALPFLDSLFLLPLAREFAGGDEFIALGRAAGQLQAAAIVAPAGLGRWSTWQPSQLPLGPWLVPHGVDGTAAADSLLRQLPGFALGLGLTQLDPQFTPRGETDSPRCQALDYLPTAWVDVAGSFDAYWEARGKNLRSNMRKQRNKLAADGVSVAFSEIVDADAVPQALAEYGALESASWKAGGGTAIHPDNAQGRFYAQMLDAFCRAGRARLWRLAFDGRPVALDLCIESGSTLVILKTTFDASQRAVSPAFLLKQEAFAQVFAQQRIRRIEFYGRLMEWHTRWSENSRMLHHANVYRWGWLPGLRAMLPGRSAERTASPAATAGATTTADD